MADHDVERRQKSVFYESCSSTFKDDFPTLVKCLRHGDQQAGNPHTRQEAGFLLWHHALEGDDVNGLVAAGVVAACVANLDAADVSSTDKGCSAGILLALSADEEEVAEAAVKARAASGNSCLEVLHHMLKCVDATMARAYCAKLLHSFAKQVPSLVLKSMEGGLPHLPQYVSVWESRDQKDAAVVAAVAGTVSLLTAEKPDLASCVVESGGVPALLGVLRQHKSEAACTAAVTLLSRLLAVEGATDQLITLGGIPLLVDVMGVPPRSVLHWETTILAQQAAAAAEVAAAAAANGRSSQTSGDGGTAPSTPKAGGGGSGKSGSEGLPSPSANAGQQLKTRFARTLTKDAPAAAAAAAAGATAATSSGDAAAPAPAGGANGAGAGGAGGDTNASSSPSVALNAYGLPITPVRVPLPLVIPGLHTAHGGGFTGSGAASPGAGLSPQLSSLSLGLGPDNSSASLGGGGAAAAADAPPQLPHPTDFGTNRSAVRWILLPGLELASQAAGCLASMLNRPECLGEVDRRLATHRILAHMRVAAAPKAGAEGKKKKKAALALSPEQTSGLTRLLGVLKFLSMSNTNRYRIAHLESVPTLILLYEEGTDFLLRNHCQAILSNVALLAENGRELLDSKVPEEFLVSNPMRLTAEERTVLRVEFPLDGTLEEESVAAAAAVAGKK